MTFGEKVKTLRKTKDMSQTQLAQAVGVSLRTVGGWEKEGRYPKQHELYQKLADTLGCDVSYLMTEEESFITEATEQYGSRGARQAQQILEQAAAMFAGGELSDEDKLTVARARKIQRFLSQPFFVAEQFTGTPGKYVPLKETIRGFKGIIDGDYDNLPEQAFYMVGTIDEAVEKAKNL